MARAGPVILAAGGTVLRQNGNDKSAKACGQYGDTLCPMLMLILLLR
jgi:hypothetical protein